MNSKSVCISIDVEPDCPPYLDSYHGIEKGIPALLRLLQDEGCPATFLSTANVAERYPDRIRQIVDSGHELGCHGYDHQRFDRLSLDRAQNDIDRATKILRQFYPVTSFRAPNLQFPEEYIPLLEASNYTVDSSQAKYKPWQQGQRNSYRLSRIPTSTTSSVLRLPKWLRFAILGRLKSPVVLFVHPWEFVDFRKEKRLRLDCRFRTGKEALKCLQETIQFFKRRQATFLPLKSLRDHEPDSQ